MPPGKSIVFHKKETEKIELVARPEEYSAVNAGEHCGRGADHGQVPQGHSLSGIIEYANGNKPQEWSGYQQFSAALGKWI